MGTVCSDLLQRVVSQEAFDKRQSGPTLRRLFGAYRNPDFWAVYRRFRAIDDGNGYVSYEELLQCVALAEYQLLFIWETFSQQNELIHARELMTVICAFSSAPLIEKAKFLQALFDDSHTGLNTAAEIVSVLHMVLAVLTKCTGIPVKVKEVREQVKSILPDLLPVWAEVLERAQGKSEVAFNNERFIGQIEMEQLIPSLKATYETLPIAGPPPPGAMAPPPPDWATPASLEKGVPKPKDNKPGKAEEGKSNKPLSKTELGHLEWMAKMDEDDEEQEEGKENLQGNALRAAPIIEDQEKGSNPPAQAYLVIYGTDFSAVAKNLASFRHLFMRSVAAALGLPMGCVEVINITRAGPGSVLIDFLLQPSARDRAERDGATLKEALGEQLTSPHSALRKGPFKEYVLTAEMVERPQKSRGNTADASAGGQRPGRRRDQEMQTEGIRQDEEMKELLEDLERTEGEAREWQRKAEQAMEERDAALKELAALRGE